MRKDKKVYLSSSIEPADRTKNRSWNRWNTNTCDDRALIVFCSVQLEKIHDNRAR